MLATATLALLADNGLTIKRESGKFVVRDASGTEIARHGRKASALSLAVAFIFSA